MDDPVSIKREIHRLLQKFGRGAIDTTAAEAQLLLESVHDGEHSFTEMFRELELKKTHVTGQYEAEFTPPWFGKWQEKIHVNSFSGYPDVGLLRHEA